MKTNNSNKQNEQHQEADPEFEDAVHSFFKSKT
jgi:hypothetical protein